MIKKSDFSKVYLICGYVKRKEKRHFFLPFLVTHLATERHIQDWHPRVIEQILQILQTRYKWENCCFSQQKCVK